MKIFSGSSSKELARKIAGHLKLELSPVEIFVFPDGEKRIRIKDKVLGESCVIVQSAGIPTDENYMELFIMIDALKRSGAKSVKTVIPYLGYQRQDHIFRSGEAVSLEVIAKILTSVGMTELFSFDLHSPKIPEIFKVPVHHLSALPLFAERIKKLGENIVLVSPDMGGIRRIKQVSEMLGNISFATIEKNRDLSSGEISNSGLNGDVRGKTAVIVDDMISTAVTTVDATNLLIEKGAKRVFAFATHGVFAKYAGKILQKSKIEKVVVSDTIEIPPYKTFPKLELISIAETAAKAILK
ncbi:MAG: ribose-phosphate pyrophosphokinase [Candidatus Levybacteria bacterium CG10_big_fil_rev_8_21_14_0_10_35_13]|nr:MAG: ribose-phosphate pyrophosphokinase [Candidatus Levybacteria bacterium CG10_big_fil_rev_8_21_14_0_10_35_13]